MVGPHRDSDKRKLLMKPAKAETGFGHKDGCQQCKICGRILSEFVVLLDITICDGTLRN